MIQEIRIDDALWTEASALRRDDWRVSITDLLEDAELGVEGEQRLVICRAPDAVVCTTFDAHAMERARHEVRTADLRPHVEEYLAIIRRLHGDDGESRHSPRMAAFDMAKKVVHDGAAKTLARAMPGLAPDHEAYRRLFSLLFAVVVDVTALPGARAHRRHGER